MRRFAIALLLILTACAVGPVRQGPTASAPPVSQRPPVPLPTLLPTATGAPAPPPGAAGPPDTGWLPAAPGAERRQLQVSLAGQVAPVTIVRLDPAQISFSVGYNPDAPPLLPEWAARSGALAVINGGFFDADGQTVALLVHAGQPVGASYEGRGGMFAVAPDGAITLRALADTPYDPAEPLAEALQGWPMLVRPGGAAAYTYEDGERDRRSAVALDRAGRVLLIAAPSAAFTLAELSAWLAGSDLDLDAALNLDGGASTGLILLSAEHPERINAFAPLPIVLLAHRR